MCIGIDKDKATYANALKQKGRLEFNITGKAMKDYVFVSEKGIDKEEDLEYWVQLALDFNPLAKSSKK